MIQLYNAFPSTMKKICQNAHLGIYCGCDFTRHSFVLAFCFQYETVDGLRSNRPAAYRSFISFFITAFTAFSISFPTISGTFLFVMYFLITSSYLRRTIFPNLMKTDLRLSIFTAISVGPTVIILQNCQQAPRSFHLINF